MKKTEKKTSKKSNVTSVLIVLSQFLVGGLFGVFAVTVFTDTLDLSSPAQLGLGLVCIGLIAYLAVMIPTILHEAGHLIFGLLTGYGFSSFRIGPLMLLKTPSGLRFKRHSVAGTGGQCLLTPPQLKDGQMPYVLYNLGGSIVNLLTAVLFFLIFLALGKDSVLGLGAVLTALISLVFALTNGIPLRLGAVDNDGRNAVYIGKNPPALRAFWVQLKVNELSVQGLRIRDMPEDLFQLPEQEDMNNSMCVSLAVLAENRLMDKHQFEQAESLICRLLEEGTGILGLHKSLLQCDLLYCRLISQAEPAQIAKLHTNELVGFMKAMKTFPTVIRTQFAYALLAENLPDKAAKLEAKLRKLSANYPSPQDIEAELELVEFAREIYLKTQNATVS